MGRPAPRPAGRDSEGEEGKFYVWTAAEIDALLPPEDAALFKATYDVTPEGNWEHKAILNRRRHAGMLSDEAEARLAACRATLFAARARRIPPGRDDKILADWNGLTIAALARAATVFDRPEWLADARRAFAFIAKTLRASDGRLVHAWRDGRAGAAGLLDDHAAMARAALALHEATGEPAFLRQAVAWAENAERHFAAEDGGGYFTSAADATDVLVRGRTAADNATPSGNGLMAEVQARLFHLTGEDRWRQAAERTIGAFSGHEGLAAMPTLLAAADLLSDGATVALVGDPADPATRALARAALAHPDPAVVLLRVAPEAAGAAALPAAHPAHGKGMVGGRPAAYVCRGATCSLPVTDPDALHAALARPPADPVALLRPAPGGSAAGAAGGA